MAPSVERVANMLTGTMRPLLEVLGKCPPNYGEVTVEKVGQCCVTFICNCDMSVASTRLDSLVGCVLPPPNPWSHWQSIVHHFDICPPHARPCRLTVQAKSQSHFVRSLSIGPCATTPRPLMACLN